MRNFDNLGRLKVFIKDPRKKSFLKILKELTVLTIKKKEIPFYYFKYLYRKKINNYLDYLSRKEVNAIINSKILHSPEYKLVFDNKMFSCLFFEKAKIKTPQLISYNLGNMFFLDNDYEKIRNKNDIQLFFEKVFNKYSIEGLFFRPPSGYGGNDCFKLSKENFKKNRLPDYDTIVNGNFVHTEVVNQHEEINKIHDKSLCTLRIISLITPNNDIEIISASIRFGVGDSVVDNASSGGFIVGINIDDGTLKETGYYLLEYGGAEINKHPSSDFKFEGFKVPFFEDACKLVKSAVKIIPDRFIGWDVGITPDGPTIIEGNSEPLLPLIDVTYGGFLKNEHMKNLINELKSQ